MASGDTWVAALLGLIEGLTEFIPVSSTGHLLLAGHFLGFPSETRSFEVMIQLGAILAIVFLYVARLGWAIRGMRHDPAARMFVLSVVVAFLPSVVVGLVAYDFIKAVLFEAPVLIAWMLIAGGIVLLWVDRITLRPRHHDAARLPLRVALGVGLCQLVAMVPGVSRSGATIVGALFLGADRRTAAEFSFFLAVPTMVAAFSLDVIRNRDLLEGAAVWDIVVGFAVAFVSAVVVVRWMLRYLEGHGFALFGWWRIIVGTAALIGLWWA